MLFGRTGDPKFGLILNAYIALARVNSWLVCILNNLAQGSRIFLALAEVPCRWIIRSIR